MRFVLWLQKTLEGLQHCILDFTNRLHSAEIDRNHLRHANSALKKKAAVRHANCMCAYSRTLLLKFVVDFSFVDLL
jgi:hypothetical protein